TALEFHSLGLILSISMTSCSFIGSFKKIPFIPFAKGEILTRSFFSSSRSRTITPLLKKHALSQVEGRGQGRFMFEERPPFKSAAVDCANQYFVDRCNPLAVLLARRMAFLPIAARSANYYPRSRRAPTMSVSRLN